MERPKIEIRFYETYYLANIVRNILHDQFAFIRNLNEFYGDGAYLRLVTPYRRNSAFHAFIFHVTEEVILDATMDLEIENRQELAEKYASLPVVVEHIRPSHLPINEALKFHAIPHPSFDDYLKKRKTAFADATQEDVHEYVMSLRDDGAVDELLDRMVSEVFFVLFQNRGLLLLFNEMIASQVEEAEPDEIEEEYRPLFAKKGVLRRVRPPKWVRRAVFYRDRGCCVLCHNDLSGLVSIWPAENFDHIVPLESGGLNDVSNIQLLCRRCNERKAAGKAATTDIYEAWYPMGNGH